MRLRKTAFLHFLTLSAASSDQRGMVGYKRARCIDPCCRGEERCFGPIGEVSVEACLRILSPKCTLLVEEHWLLQPKVHLSHGIFIGSSGWRGAQLIPSWFRDIEINSTTQITTCNKLSLKPTANPQVCDHPFALPDSISASVEWQSPERIVIRSLQNFILFKDGLMAVAVGTNGSTVNNLLCRFFPDANMVASIHIWRPINGIKHDR